MQIKLTLDKNVDSDVIEALEKKANGGPITKALYRAILEWHAGRASTGAIQTQDDLIEVPDMPPAGPDGLAGALASIEEGWRR
jgi:hypothetical protein